MNWSIRRYAGTLPDARGILAVEHEVFNECPYRAEELQSRLGEAGQRPWLAEAGGQIVGFLCGLRVHGPDGPRLEADLLAVHPAWRRRGIATALLTALRRDATGVAGLRGVVSPENHASSRAFARAGFKPTGEVCDLLIYRIRGWIPRPLPAWGGTVRPLQSIRDAVRLSAFDSAAFPSAERVAAAAQDKQTLFLLAESNKGIVGAATLLEVHTLIYAGLWVESIATAGGWRRAEPALIVAAVEAAKERGLDEVGCMVPQGWSPLKGSLLAEGFVPLDRYRAWTASPLPIGGDEA